MANDYYTRQGSYTKGTLARGDVVKTDFDALVTAWDTGQTNHKRALKMPDEGSPQTDFAITANAATRATKVIGFDSLGAIELQTGVGSWEGTWATSTAYTLRDVVVDGAAGGSTDNLYVCIVAHTSGTFSTDLTASKWELMVDVEESRNWAKKTDGVVADSEYSSKAYAIGGTGVTDTAGKGASKEWATETSGTVDGTLYSSKEYAVGTQASTGGSAKDYAVKVDGGVSGATSDHSSKAWAVGGTGVTDTASKGAAKEWATETSGTVDTSSYSAKEYAQGTQASTGGSAKDYAQKVNGGVSGATSDHSSKAWAVGGTGVTTTASKGASKEWATTTGGYVDTAEYSAKEYAIGTTVAAGSAKDWAMQASGTVDGTSYSAKYNADAAATSATSASSSASTATTQASAASTSATSAASSATSAAASYDSFDDRYLGVKSSDPTLDNDSNALVDGALYFNTTNNVMMVYDLGNTTWLRTTPTSTDQGHINTVSGIQANVTTVAGISSDVTSVAGKATEIGLLGVAGVITDMGILGTADVVADMNTLGTADVVTDMNTLGTADVVADLNTLGTADVVADMNTLATAGNVTAMDNCSGSIANINTVSGSIANVNTTASNITGVNSFAERYRVESSNPTTSLDEGDLAYNTTSNALSYYDGTSWNAITSDTDVKVGVSSNDTTAGYLNGKLVAGTLVTLTENSDGGNETLTIASTGDASGTGVAMAIALGG